MTHNHNQDSRPQFTGTPFSYVIFRYVPEDNHWKLVGQSNNPEHAKKVVARIVRGGKRVQEFIIIGPIGYKVAGTYRPRRRMEWKAVQV